MRATLADWSDATAKVRVKLRSEREKLEMCLTFKHKSETQIRYTPVCVRSDRCIAQECDHNNSTTVRLISVIVNYEIRAPALSYRSRYFRAAQQQQQCHTGIGAGCETIIARSSPARVRLRILCNLLRLRSSSLAKSLLNPLNIWLDWNCISAPRCKSCMNAVCG